MDFEEHKKKRKLANKKIIQHMIRNTNRHKFEELERYYDDIELKFRSDKKELSQRYDDEIKNGFNDPFIKSEIDENFSEEFYWIEEVFIRNFRYSTIVTIYSLLEISLNGICRYLFREKKLALQFDEVRGDGIERAKLYLSKVCLLDFPEGSNEWNMMKKLNKVRNCVVHAQGIFLNVKSPKTLRNVIDHTPGLSIKGETYLNIETSFITEAIKNAEALISKVYEKAFEMI